MADWGPSIEDSNVEEGGAEFLVALIYSRRGSPRRHGDMESGDRRSIGGQAPQRTRRERALILFRDVRYV